MNQIKKTKQRIEKKQGITLIALVLTIIVLLILAGVSIATLIGENGILTKATKAEERTIKAQIKEEIELKIMEIQTEEMEKSKQITLETLTERLVDKGTVGSILNNKIIGEYKNYQFKIDENFSVTIEESDIVINDIYHVSNKGNDENGNGSIKKPYASLKKAIEEAKTGSTIKIEEGVYHLEPMQADINGSAGIFDENKELLIYGENEKTILKYDATSYTTRRDAPAFYLDNENTIVRNIVFEFQPRTITEGSYQTCLFKCCKGTIENVFIRIKGATKCSYLYFNEQSKPNHVINCTFYHDLGAVGGNYSGICNFNNIATNVETQGTNTNVITKNFGSTTMDLSNLIKASKEDEDFINNQVGVYYGTYAWK